MPQTNWRDLPSRRRFLGLVIASLAAPVLAACGQAATPTAAPAKPTEPPKPAGAAPTTAPAQAATKPAAAQAAAGAPASTPTVPPARPTLVPQANAVKLNYWDMQWGPAQFMNELQDIVTGFNEANPKIHVSFSQMSWGDYNQKLLSATQAGTPPDMSGGGGSTPVVMDAQGQALDLADLYRDWKADGTLDDLVPWAHQKWNFNGKYPGATWQFDGRAIFYRKDMFQQAGIAVPTTWDEWLAAAQKLTDTSKDIIGVAVPGKQGSFDTDQFYMTLAFQSGARLADADGNPSFDTPEHLRALEFEKKLVGCCSSKGVPSWAFTEVTKTYSQSKAAMCFNGGWLIGDLSRNTPEVFDRSGLLPVLIGPGGKEHQKAVAFANAWLLYKQSKAPDEAKTFMKHMLTKENLKRLYAADLGNKWPVHKSLINDPIFQKNEVVKTFAEQVVQYGIDYWYPNNKAAYKLTTLGTTMADRVINPVLVGQREPKDALKDQQEKMMAAFQEKK